MPDPDTLSDNYDDPPRLERELQAKGWHPVLMRDELTGLPLTRWLPPAKDVCCPERGLSPGDADRPAGEDNR